MSKILIIDDEANIRTMMRLALEHSGYEVDVAEDGSSGLEKYATNKDYDVVLLDQRMPGMHGMEVLQDIRRENPSAKVILTTAFGTAELANRAMATGATDFLKKPFTADSLRLAVKSAIDSKDSKAGTNSCQFERTTLNGYQIELLTEIHDRHFGEVICTYRVTEPTGSSATVKVIVPQYVIELVKAHTDTETVPCQNKFWQALSEEALANYLWQEAKIPPGQVLKVEELTPAIKRWVDAVMTIESEAENA